MSNMQQEDELRTKESSSSKFTSRMNNILGMLDSGIVKNNRNLRELSEALFGKEVEEERSEAESEAFAGLAGMWLSTLRNINYLMNENTEIIASILKEFAKEK